MANMNNDGAASVAPVFELRDISADAVFMMTALLSKLGVGQLLQLVSAEASKASFEPPMTMKDGKQVPLPLNKWTEKQRAAAIAAQEAQNVMITKAIELMLSTFASCKNEIFALLADGYGCTVEDIEGISGVELIELIDGYVNRDAFVDFFTRALKLFTKTSSSGSRMRFTAAMAAGRTES